MKVLILDNYDSFTFNLFHLLDGLGADVIVKRNDEINSSEIGQFEKIILSPGPGLPNESPTMMKVIADWYDKRPMLGVCLGAQIIAEALGAKTERSPNKEIGVYPVELTAAGQRDPLFKHFLPRFDVMHWHNDMPGIPSGAEILAKSEGCPRQAYRYGDRVYGLQFHLEMTNKLVNGMIEHCSNDLIVNTFVKSTQELQAENLENINQKMFVILEYLTQFILGKK